METAAKPVHQAESKVALGEWKRAWGPSLVALLIAERDFLPGVDAPLRETGYQVLMQELASQGNVAEALDVYATLRAVLRDELGVSPSVRTQVVYDQLMHA